MRWDREPLNFFFQSFVMSKHIWRKTGATPARHMGWFKGNFFAETQPSGYNKPELTPKTRPKPEQSAVLWRTLPVL